jgi:hypothetical protein
VQRAPKRLSSSGERAEILASRKGRIKFIWNVYIVIIKLWKKLKNILYAQIARKEYLKWNKKEV